MKTVARYPETSIYGNFKLSIKMRKTQKKTLGKTHPLHDRSIFIMAGHGFNFLSFCYSLVVGETRDLTKWSEAQPSGTTIGESEPASVGEKMVGDTWSRLLLITTIYLLLVNELEQIF